MTTMDPPATPAPFLTHNETAPGPAVILCDHASNHDPACVNGGDLGLSDADMSRHIAYDVGAAGLAAALAPMLDASAVLSQFSRLVIDPNRGADDPTLVMKLYDGSIIPANRHADAAEVARRKRAFFDPYHAEVTRVIDRVAARGTPPRLISIHSYTPQLRGRPPRPWHVGVLWDRDDRLAGPLIRMLRKDPDLVIGDNEPYTGQLQGDCMYTHGTLRGLPHVLIEVRNDLIETEAAQRDWAARLAPALKALIPVAA